MLCFLFCKSRILLVDASGFVRIVFYFILYYFKESQNDCDTCIGSTYTDKDGQGKCKSCPKGFAISSPNVDDHNDLVDCQLDCILSQQKSPLEQL